MMISTYLLLLSAACILSEENPVPQASTINRKYTEIEKAPWEVSIQLRLGQSIEHYCGGSLFSARIIITAAQCFYIADPFLQGLTRLLDNKEILIVAGSEFKRPREILAGVSAKVHHVNFSIPIFNNNIGIMQLLNPLPISNQVKPIPLALKNPAPGSVALSTGWGFLEGMKSPVDTPIFPEVLQGIDLTIQNSESCNIYLKEAMREDLICIETAEQLLCLGDGSPLTFENTLVGVASNGYNCTGHALYSSVAYYRKWLIKEINNISKN